MKIKIKKKKFSLKEQYILSWKYLKECKNFIYFAIGLFFIFSLIGFFVPASSYIEETIKDFIEKLIEKTEGMNSFELILFIFFNNLQVSFFGMILGVFLGIFPLIYIIGNGYILGFVSMLVAEQGGAEVLLKLLPHGIFELPAIFISLALGLKFGTFIFQKKKAESFKEYLFESIRIFLFVVIPLLIIAAIIEGSLMFA